MKALTQVGGFLAVTITAGWTISLCGQQLPESPTGRYIITLKTNFQAGHFALSHGLIPRHVFDGEAPALAGEASPAKLQELAADPRVVAITPDLAMSAFGEAQGESARQQQVVPAGIERVGAAPGTVGYTGTNIGVAVLDTGLDLRHPDLPCATNSYSAYGLSAQDDNGHGTHVGGIIAARDNDRDVVGVAPGATLYAVKVLDHKAQGYDSDLIAGLNWVRENGPNLQPPIKVVNLSLGRPASRHDEALHEAVRSVVAAGITVVVAAGNDSTKEVRQMVPGGFPEVIAVASTTARQGRTSGACGAIAADTASFFTTDGAMDRNGVGVAISAPGEDAEEVTDFQMDSVGILSTRLGGGTTRMAGTSMAAPHVAGAVALLYEKAELEGIEFAPIDAKLAVMNGDRIGLAPLDSLTSGGYGSGKYTFDGDREGVLNVTEALKFLDSLPTLVHLNSAKIPAHGPR